MARTEQAAVAPARARVGLPIVPDGSRERPLLLRLPSSDGAPSRCNNGCPECLSQPVQDAASDFGADVRGRHVVLRDREAAMRSDLPELVRALKGRGPAKISLLTNGRLLVYPAVARGLVRAGVDHFVIKLFGLDAASHDAHTRVPGSFQQALDGLRAARALRPGAAVVTYPILLEGSAEERSAETSRRVELARRLTDRDPCEMPEPRVESYAGEYHYDLMALRDGVSHPYWTERFFPLAYVNTGPVCNIRCVYCNVKGGDDQRLYDRAYVASLIDAAAAHLVGESRGAGVPTLEFIGGEPTLHPSLPALVRHARDAGFPQITICTNGMLLLRKSYLDQLVSSGLTGVRFSFHDHRPDVASALADTGDLGARYLDVATTLLSRTELTPYIYRILLSSTIDALGDYVRWLAEHNRTGRTIELALGMPSMRGRLLDNPHLYPSLEGLREKVGAAIELATSLGIEVLLYHTPACLHPTEPERSACTHIEPMQVEALAGTRRPMNFEGDARYGEACSRCAARSEGCQGLPSAYFEADSARAEAWLVPIEHRDAGVGA